MNLNISFWSGFFPMILILCAGCGYTLHEERIAREVAADPEYKAKYIGTPAQFYAEQVREARLEIFALKEYTLPRYGKSVRRIYDLARNVKRGMDWKFPVRQCMIPFLKNSPEIDGIISGDEWKGALEFRGEYKLDMDHPLSGSSAVWKVGYDSEHLYFAAVFRDEKVTSYSAHSFRGEEKPFYRGDCFEVFIRPDLNSLHYFEFLQNAKGEEWNMFHVHSDGGRWKTADFEFQAYRKTAVRHENGILTYETAIPFRILFSKWSVNGARAGDRFSFMPARCDRNGDIFRQTVPYPLLYDMHNLFGYMEAELQSEEK